MAITVDKLINDDRFCGENVLQFILYLPFGIVLLALRLILALILWVASILLPNSQTVRQLLSTVACWTFGVYVKLKGSRDARSSVMVANCVSCLDSLAASHALGTISLKKWKVPPFFASTLGIKNAAQCVRKQQFAESPNKPVLLQPEGGATNGKGVLRFTDWPFQIGNRVQPMTITVQRPFTNVTVHRPSDTRDKFPWSDALWFLWTPVTVFQINLLPALERHDDDDAVFSQRMRESIAESLGVEVTEYKWEELNRPGSRRRRSNGDLAAVARRVQDVLPAVPLPDIMRDLAMTRSVDVTITNFLEGVTPYRALGAAGASAGAAGPGAGAAGAGPAFPTDPRQRQLGFRERKAQMIAEARARYVHRHGLDIALLS